MSIGQDGESPLRVVSQQQFERHGLKLVSCNELPRGQQSDCFTCPPTSKILVIGAKDFESQAVDLYHYDY